LRAALDRYCGDASTRRKNQAETGHT
jgi:hypothetical protein